jgi:hypothetical protein
LINVVVNDAADVACGRSEWTVVPAVIAVTARPEMRIAGNICIAFSLSKQIE